MPVRNKLVGLRPRVDTPSPAVCRLCASAMPEHAVKCKACGALHGWRSFLPASDVTLSLLIALLSLTGMVTPIIVSVLQRHSKTTVTIIGGTETDLFVAASNVGKRPSVIQALRIHFEGIPLSDFYLDVPPENMEQTFLAPDAKPTLKLRHEHQAPMVGYSAADVDSGIATGRVQLTAVVKESSDEDPEKPSERVDWVPAKRLKIWIKGCLK